MYEKVAEVELCTHHAQVSWCRKT